MTHLLATSGLDPAPAAAVAVAFFVIVGSVTGAFKKVEK